MSEDESVVRKNREKLEEDSESLDIEISDEEKEENDRSSNRRPETPSSEDEGSEEVNQDIGKGDDFDHQYEGDEHKYFSEIKDHYRVQSDGVPAKITIGEKDGEHVDIYKLDRPEISGGTGAFVENLREKVVQSVQLSRDEFTETNEVERVKQKFKEAVEAQLGDMIPEADDRVVQILIGNLIHEMVGLGDLEILLEDPDLEEMVVNSSDEPTWVYHKEYGWLKTNITFEDENEIYNYASDIARRVGKNITSLNPLLDAHLSTGDRTNATLSPISTHGNTITIRKFARDPWTITDFIQNDTVTKEVAAFLWTCMQYELSVLVSGGTGSGKTSLLNVLTPFIPPSQRVISIEDTRELQLPEFLHWVPLTTREANPEGKGEISMLDLLVNSLRMRPDRMVVGEVRKKRQAEILFEAMHTGHSVYSTLHADTAQQTVQRLLNPPLDIAEQMVQSIDINVVMFRDRRRNFRRIFEVSEITKAGYKRGAKEMSLGANNIYEWNSSEDELQKKRESDDVMDKLQMHTGMDRSEVYESMEDKQKILGWMLEKDINSVDNVGRIVSKYYSDPEKVIAMAENNQSPEKIFSEYQ